MILLAHDFWSLLVYGFLASVIYIGYRCTWRLAHICENLIVGLAQTGIHRLARGLLFATIGYTEQTYQQSRFIVWNQVHVRFFVLWGTTFLFSGLVFILQIPTMIWLGAAVSVIGLRLITLWLNPPRPPINTQDPALKQLIQDVNEPLRSTPKKSVRPVIRRWDYLDELFAEPV